MDTIDDWTTVYGLARRMDVLAAFSMAVGTTVELYTDSAVHDCDRGLQLPLRWCDWLLDMYDGQYNNLGTSNH